MSNKATIAETKLTRTVITLTSEKGSQTNTFWISFFYWTNKKPN